MSKQIIEQNGEPAFVVIPWHEWQRIEAVLEDRADAAAIQDCLDDPTEGFPEDVVRAIAVERRNPLRVLREYRGLTQAALAGAAGTSAVYLSQIERGARNPGHKTLHRLAAALGVDAEMLDSGPS